MPIKTTSGPRCLKHQIECMYNCGWCGKSICDECVAAAHGKKYCDKCWQKKSQLSGGPSIDESTPKGAGPRTPVKNVDHTLDQAAIEKQRAAFQARKDL